jgi:hypothetical protein
VPEPHKPERKRRKMTIAIGYHCLNGVVVTADTLVVIGADAQEGTKLDSRWTKHGKFAFVNSSDDGNATATLTEDIFHAIENSAVLQNYHELGGSIKAIMTSWRQGFGGRKPPATQLILAAQLGGLQARLYACDPPFSTRRPSGRRRLHAEQFCNTFFSYHAQPTVGGDSPDCRKRRFRVQVAGGAGI